MAIRRKILTQISNSKILLYTVAMHLYFSFKNSPIEPACTKVLLLDDAEGNTWIMKGFQLGLKPQHTSEQFVATGQSIFNKLPAGWKLRIKVLDKDYIETPETGVATIMPDEFFNIWNKTGPGMSNYKP